MKSVMRALAMGWPAARTMPWTVASARAAADSAPVAHPARSTSRWMLTVFSFSRGALGTPRRELVQEADEIEDVEDRRRGRGVAVDVDVAAGIPVEEAGEVQDVE